MKLPRFEYRRPRDLDEALAGLGEDVKVLAGGQSLLPAMAFRIARPAVLVDIDRLPGLDRIQADDGELRIGALVRHAALERAGLGVLSEAARHVGHLPIRLRGTLGGSIAHADPAAELCVAALALDAQVVARSVRGVRAIAAEDFFVGPYTTALAADELVVEVRFPQAATGAFEELAERAGDFALASACVRVAPGFARIAIGSAGPTPLRARRAEQALVEGAGPAEAGQIAAAECEPASDSHASAQYRRELVAVLVRRALERALA